MKRLVNSTIVALLLLFLVPIPMSASDSLLMSSNQQLKADPLFVPTDQQPKDEQVLKALAKAGIDKNYVKLEKDYGKSSEGKSPYTKTWVDQKSGTRVMEISQLPMVNADGSFLDTTWSTKDGKNFSAGINQFIASVATNKVTVIVLNDQPDGKVKKDMALSFQPQLYVDGKEVKPSVWTPTLLAVDPLNSNYTNNTLEWDYGICKRELRLIEGSILGSWVFPSKPSGTINIKYNQSGDFKLRLGRFAINSDEEQVTPKQFDELALIGGYPVTISDSATFYPDPTTSVDGMVMRYGTNLTWDDIVTGAGTNSDDAATTMDVEIYSDTTAWIGLGRVIILFPTAALPDTANISAAVLSPYFYTFGADGGNWQPGTNVY